MFTVHMYRIFFIIFSFGNQFETLWDCLAWLTCLNTEHALSLLINKILQYHVGHLIVSIHIYFSIIYNIL